MQSKTREQLNDQLAELLKYLTRESRSNLLDQWQALDITIQQAKLLDILDRSGPMRMGALSNKLGNTLSATTSLVNRLEEKELLERAHDRDDRRAVVCLLTTQGERSIAEPYKAKQKEMAALLRGLDADEMQAVLDGLRILSQTVNDARGE